MFCVIEMMAWYFHKERVRKFLEWFFFHPFRFHRYVNSVPYHIFAEWLHNRWEHFVVSRQFYGRNSGIYVRW